MIKDDLESKISSNEKSITEEKHAEAYSSSVSSVDKCAGKR